MKNKTYTAAIIGISGFGATHFRDLTERYPPDSMKIAGATVINQDEEVEKCDYLRSHGCEIFSDYREMLEKLDGKIDLCCIPTGIGMHNKMTVAALKAGANVFVEKPLCATIQEAAVMKDAELKSGKFVIVGYQHMAQPSELELKRILLSGQLGAVKSLKFTVPGRRFKPYYFRNNWAGKIRTPDGEWVLDSPYNNASAHPLNLILFLAGTDFESSAQLKNITAELYRAKEYIENADTCFMQMETVDGKKLYYSASHSCNEGKGNMLVECEHGSVTTRDGSYVVLHRNGEEELMPTKLWRHPVTRTIYNKLRDPSAFSCSIDIAATQTLAMNGAHESSRIVKVPEEFTEIHDEGGEKEVTVIKNLEQIMAECYEKSLLPHELGNIPWAEKGALFDLRDYHAFSGGLTG